MVRRGAETGEAMISRSSIGRCRGWTGSRPASAFLPLGSQWPASVMVTAYGREDVLKKAEENGFENVLIKPVTSSMLLDTTVGAWGPRASRMRPSQAGRLRYRPHSRRACPAGRGQ